MLPKKEDLDSHSLMGNSEVEDSESRRPNPNFWKILPLKRENSAWLSIQIVHTIWIFFPFISGLNLQFLKVWWRVSRLLSCNMEGGGDGDTKMVMTCTSSTSFGSSRGSRYRLFSRQASIHQCMGGAVEVKVRMISPISFVFEVQFASFTVGFLFHGLPLMKKVIGRHVQCYPND